MGYLQNRVLRYKHLITHFSFRHSLLLIHVYVYCVEPVKLPNVIYYIDIFEPNAVRTFIHFHVCVAGEFATLKSQYGSSPCQKWRERWKICLDHTSLYVFVTVRLRFAISFLTEKIVEKNFLFSKFHKVA